MKESETVQTQSALRIFINDLMQKNFLILKIISITMRDCSQCSVIGIDVLKQWNEIF